MNVQIRTAKIEDLVRIQELSTELFREEIELYDPLKNIGWSFSESGTEYFRGRITEPNGIAFVAVVDHSIVGYLTAGIYDPVPWRNTGKRSELENLFVLKEYRN